VAGPVDLNVTSADIGATLLESDDDCGCINLNENVGCDVFLIIM
jgi:hypothetical protein